MPQYVRPQKLREEQGWFDPPQLAPAPRGPEDLHGGVAKWKAAISHSS